MVGLQIELESLKEQYESVEADRTARLKVIETQGKRISELESEVDRWLGESERLQQEYSDAERKRNGFLGKTWFQACEGNE